MMIRKRLREKGKENDERKERKMTRRKEGDERGKERKMSDKGKKER